MPEQKKTRSELKREAIVEAAKEAFNLYGVKDTSMDKLAEMAQVSKRTVYNHFESKEVLVMEIITELWQNVEVPDAATFSTETPLEQQLSALVAADIDLLSCQQYIDMVRVAIGHVLYHPEACKEQMEKFKEKETALQKWIKAAIKHKALKEVDAEFASDQIKSLIKGAAFWPQIMHKGLMLTDKEKDQLIQSIVGMFLGYYRN